MIPRDREASFFPVGTPYFPTPRQGITSGLGSSSAWPQPPLVSSYHQHPQREILSPYRPAREITIGSDANLNDTPPSEPLTPIGKVPSPTRERMGGRAAQSYGDGARPPYAGGPSASSGTHDAIFSGGIHIRIRNGLSREHILIDEFDVTIVLRSLVSPSTADAASQKFFPRVEMFVQGSGTPASHCVGSYSLSQLTTISAANSARTLLLEFLPVTTAATMRSGPSPSSPVMSAAAASEPDPSAGLTFLVQLIFPDTAARNRVHQAISAAHMLSRETLAVAAATVSKAGDGAAPPTLSDALATVRRLQQKTHKLLDEVRSESIGEIEGLGINEPPGGVGGGKQLRNWAMLMLDRRKRLEDAHDALSEIQNRRAMRQHALAQTTSASAADFDAWQPSAAAPPPAPTSAPTSPERSILFSESSVGSNKKTRLVCPHCSKRMSVDPTHEERCARRPVRCRVCKELMVAGEFRHHRKYECPGGVASDSGAAAAEDRAGSSAGSFRRTSSALGPPLSPYASFSENELDDEDRRALKEVRRSSRYLLGRKMSTAGGSGSGSFADPVRRRDSMASTVRPSDLQRRQSSSGDFGAFVEEEEDEGEAEEIPRAASSSGLRRKASTLDATQTHCPHCSRRAPASHNARCAHRIVTCSDCGATMKAKEAAEHAATMHAAGATPQGSNRRFKFP
jgi:hypothetical protein